MAWAFSCRRCEIFVGLLFASHPRYLTWLREARELLPLRL
jgi:hypothetical protein